MTLIHILVFAAFSMPVMWFISPSRRSWFLLSCTLGAVIWLMVGEEVITLDIAFFVATLILLLAVWWVVREPDKATKASLISDRIALGIVSASVLLVLGLFLQLGIHQFLSGIVGVGLVVIMLVGKSQFLSESRSITTKRQFALLLIVFIVIILAFLKVPAWNRLIGQLIDSELSSISWLGFSYLAFRLLGILLDYRADRLGIQNLSLRDLTIYALFFPAFTAGPIDRAQRFIAELNEAKALENSRLIEGTSRLTIGIVKKFIVADSLALVALNSTFVHRVDSIGGLWVLLYLYTFQIFFDFSGYSDIAVGLGRLYGITLPENFDRPYLQPNLQQFWQHWHMSLSTWFRVYYFTAFSRALIRSPIKFPQWLIILLSQMTTMWLIGLWHGVTINFFLWGIWHGVGLFLHRVLADNTRQWYTRMNQHTWSKQLIHTLSVLTTFHFVALGWVFFALPTPLESLTVLRRLFGVGG